MSGASLANVLREGVAENLFHKFNRGLDAGVNASDTIGQDDGDHVLDKWHQIRRLLSKILIEVLDFEELKGSFTKFEWGMGCSADPRWTAGENWLTTSRNDWAWAGFGRATHSTILNRPTPPNDYDGERFFLPIDDGTWRRIDPSEDWLDALTPEGPD